MSITKHVKDPSGHVRWSNGRQSSDAHDCPAQRRVPQTPTRRPVNAGVLHAPHPIQPKSYISNCPQKGGTSPVPQQAPLPPPDLQMLSLLRVRSANFPPSQQSLPRGHHPFPRLQGHLEASLSRLHRFSLTALFGCQGSMG